MKKFVNAVIVAFLLGLVLIIAGIVVGAIYGDSAIFYVKLLATPGTVLVCGSTVLSAMFPIKEEK